MTYAELVTALQDYAESSETRFVANIPLFVEQAEKRIFHEAEIPQYEKEATQAISSGTPLFTLPTDYVSAYSMKLTIAGVDYYLNQKDQSYLTEMYPANVSGTPQCYAEIGGTPTQSIQFGPSPSASVTANLRYYAYPESIVTAGTSYFGEFYDNLLLYGAMREVALFQRMEEPEVIKIEAMYQEALGQYKRSANGLRRQDTYRVGRPKAPVQ
jgi:hypothetical protein